MNILQDYKVQFFNKVGYGKSLYTINGMLTGYISDHYTASKSGSLLSDVNNVLNGVYPLGGGQTQSLYFATITALETKLYQDLEVWENNNNVTPNYVLPTIHFKTIIEAWKNYLQ